jgi:hypothetical protein
MSSFAKYSALPSHAEIANLKLQDYLRPTPFDVGYGLASHVGFLEKAIAAREERLAEPKAHQ